MSSDSLLCSTSARRVVRAAEVLQLVLEYKHAQSVLPELLSVIGYEPTMKLLETFGGLVLELPTLNDLDGSLKAVETYLRVSSKKETIEEAAARRHVDVDVVRREYDAVLRLVRDRHP